jgi:CelD/BcsL family acetyltransferase involved in cellulose biosynthesis
VIPLENEPGFDFGSAEYRAFFARCGLSPFQHADWLEPLYRRLPGPAGCEPLILVGRAPGSGQLLCVIPLLRHAGAAKARVTFAFPEVTDYACPVVDPAAASRIALRDDLERLVGEHALDIRPIHHRHTALWSQLSGRQPAALSFGAHAVALAPAVADRWQSATDRPNRSRGLSRKARRLAERGELRFEAVWGEQARAAMERARALRAGRFADDPLQVEPSAGFYGDVAASENGLSRTFQLTCGGRVVAVMLGLVHGKRFHYLILACDYQHFARYSPGLLMMDRAIESWAADGGDIFDFTIGDEVFKAGFGCRRTPMYAVGAASAAWAGAAGTGGSPRPGRSSTGPGA